MNDLVYDGLSPSAVVTHCVWKRQHEGLTSSSPAEACPRVLGMGLVGLCMCVSVESGTVSRGMNLVCIYVWAHYCGYTYECSV